MVSPDFAAAVSAYRKALVNAQNLRRLADLDKDLLAHEGVSAKEAEQAEADAASAEADRDAALQALQSLNVDPAGDQGHPGRQAHRAGRRLHPLAASPARWWKNSSAPARLLQANTTQAFTVADLSKVWVMAHIFDTDVGSVHAGDSAQVSGTAAP